MAITDWDVNIGEKLATNGAFTVSYVDTADGGFSLSVVGGKQELHEDECFAMLQEAMAAIGEVKFG